MAEYYCAPHSGSQRGEVTVGDGGDPMPSPDEVNLMIVSVTKGYSHRNIPYGVDKLKGLSDRIAAETGANSVNIDTVPEEIPDDVTETKPDDSSAFPTDASELEKYDAIIWFSTTGDVLDDPAQRDAFEEYMRNGGGYAGIHAAGDTHHPGDGEWDFYLGMHGGAYFTGHPENQDAEIHVTDQVHPSNDHLPASWEVYDEWYDFSKSPRGDVHILSTVDESSYDGAAMEDGEKDHPISWAQVYQGGRVWYTARGHTHESFDEDAFIENILGGILWAGGFEEGDVTGTVWNSYTKSQITSDFDEGMKLDTTPDGRVFFTERGNASGDDNTGEAPVSVYDPESDEISTALTLDVYVGQEDGLQGITFHPDFEDNGWVFIYYSPAEVEGDQPYNLLSRFTVDGDTIDPDSESEIIRVHTQRETCCHVGGDIAFGPDGEELYLSTGDDTNPFESSGYTPIDERDGRESFDAQRTAANTNDLRGSILRIVPEDDGGYSIPDGNLFTGDEYADARDNDEVREEIYVMGCRNPFTIEVDEETGLLYYADYGPDAGSWDVERGPPGIVEFNVVSEPGFDGWPYFTGSNIPYRDYDFETGETGDAFDPENPVNDSSNNTGLEELPPAREASIFYAYGGSIDNLYNEVPEYAQEYVPDEDPWPQIEGGGAPMAGPVFRSEDGFGDNALPEYYDGKWFIMEWNQGWVKCVSFDDNGDVMEIEPFLPTEDYTGPQDMTVGPDGKLYVLEYGSGFFNPSDQGLHVIEQTDDEEGEPEPEPDQVSIPYGLDSGSETHDQTATIGDLEFDKLPNGAITQTGGHSSASLLDADSEFSIEGTDSDLLYKTEHYGSDIGYDIEVPNGTYDVTLHFAEIWWGVEGRGGTDSGEGERVFDVSIQGETVLSDYDIYAEAGSLTATTETIEGVEATDGVISISSTTQADNTKFSGIEIHQTDGEGQAGLNPAQTIRMDGDREGWEATSPQDIAGQTNPTLTLREGEEYTVTWTNVDGTPHNFVVQDGDGESLTETEIVGDEGAIRTLTFTASEEMAQYICTVHPSSMVGDIEIVDAGGNDVPISTQFWTYNNSDLSVAELIQESANAGYDAVEPYQLDDVDAISTALENNDIYMSSAHVSIGSLEGDSFEDTMSTYIDLGADTLIHAYLGDGTWGSEDAIIEWAERMNDVADATAAEGVEYGYHNHDQEFQEIGDQFGFDIFAENVNDNVHLQLDVGWALVGGADPVSVIERHSDKIDSIHMKDMTADGEFTEIGEGDVDMEAVATAAREEADVDYLIYEYDGAPSPIESMNTGADFLEDING